MPPEIVERSLLAAPAAEVWRHATSPAGVNREFRPLFRMTFPAGIERLDASVVVPGERLCRSWILLFGVVPVDWDDVTIMEIEPGRRFLERSAMMSQRLWVHERIVEPAPGGSELTDRVRFAARLPLLEPLYAPIFRATFRLRHHNLRRIFGEPS